MELIKKLEKLKTHSYAHLPQVRFEAVEGADDVCAKPIQRHEPLAYLVQLTYQPYASQDCAFRIAPSRYGMGVFATQKIHKGDFITFYPAHLVQRGKGVGSVLTGYSMIKPEYQINHSKGYSFHGNPLYTANELFVGHMINDGADTRTLTETTKEQWADDYKANIRLYNNTSYVEMRDFIAIVATRDILEGEELLVGYGPAYWVSRLEGA
jgi:hypothetical protein